MSIRIYTPKGVKDADTIGKVAKALKDAGVPYEFLTTTTTEALISAHKKDPKSPLSENAMEHLAAVSPYDERAAALIEESADAIAKSLEAKLAAIKKIQKRTQA